MFRYYDSSRTNMSVSSIWQEDVVVVVVGALHVEKNSKHLPFLWFSYPNNRNGNGSGWCWRRRWRRGNLPGRRNFLCNVWEIFSKDPQSLSKSTLCIISPRAVKVLSFASLKVSLVYRQTRGNNTNNDTTIKNPH